jgi:hypothetical protein
LSTLQCESLLEVIESLKKGHKPRHNSRPAILNPEQDEILKKSLKIMEERGEHVPLAAGNEVVCFVFIMTLIFTR